MKKTEVTAGQIVTRPSGATRDFSVVFGAVRSRNVLPYSQERPLRKQDFNSYAAFLNPKPELSPTMQHFLALIS